MTSEVMRSSSAKIREKLGVGGVAEIVRRAGAPGLVDAGPRIDPERG
jgi:hypothetical protein